MTLIVDDDLLSEVMAASFGKSEPGDLLHHFVVVVETKGGPLGVPTPQIHVAAIAPVGPEPGQDPVELFVAKAIAASVIRSTQDGPIIFAMLQLEINALIAGNEVDENRARLLDGEGRFHEAEGLFEASQLYAACRDGRRWFGVHAVTGPLAGRVDGPAVLNRGERLPCDQWRYTDLVRRSVGLLW